MIRVTFCILVVGLLGACETIEGFGRDVSTAGDAITGEAQKAEQ